MEAINFTRTTIPIKQPVQSLCWYGDLLIDVAGGMQAYELDGTVTRSTVRFAFPFDSATLSPSGRFGLIYQLFGTKGAIIELNPNDRPRPKVVREIDRSFYCADSYEYPATFLSDGDGREFFVHCPREYNKLEIEEIESGRSLTSRESESCDFFHSRLQASPSGKYLLSAGWLWHPVHWISLYNVPDSIQRPELLNALNDDSLCHSEICAAAFLDDDDTLVLAASDEQINEVEIDDVGTRWAVSPNHVAIFDLSTNTRTLHQKYSEPVGDIMVFGSFLVSFFQFPRLYDLRTGELLTAWTDIPTSTQVGCIRDRRADTIIHLAKDPRHRRFAVATNDAIIVITVH